MWAALVYFTRHSRQLSDLSASRWRTKKDIFNTCYTTQTWLFCDDAILSFPSLALRSLNIYIFFCFRFLKWRDDGNLKCKHGADEPQRGSFNVCKYCVNVQHTWRVVLWMYLLKHEVVFFSLVMAFSLRYCLWCFMCVVQIIKYILNSVDNQLFTLKVNQTKQLDDACNVFSYNMAPHEVKQWLLYTFGCCLVWKLRIKKTLGC